MSNKILPALAFAAFIALPAASHAVDVPSTVDSGRLQDRFTDNKPEPQITNDTLIKDSENSADAAKAATISFKLSSVSIEGNSVFKTGELEQFYADKIGKKVTLLEMYEVRDAITKYYRDKGYILSRAIIPAQKLSKSGSKFTIRIIEGYINDIKLDGEFKGNKSILDSYISKIRKAGPLNSNDLERYLLLINDLAGTTANAVLQPTPGKGNVGASDLIITTSHKYVNGLLSADNSGTKYIGRHLFSAEADVNSALGLSEKIAVRGIMAATNNELKFGDISYQQPIDNEGTKFKILAGRTDTHPGSTLKDFDLDGRTEVLEFTLSHPFLRSRKENFTGRAEFDLKDTTTDSFNVNLYDDKTREFTLGGTYDLADKYNGINLVDLSGTQGLDVFGASGRGDGKSRANGDVVFTKFNFEASRLQKLYGSLGVLFAASGQYSLDPLLANDEFGIGGRDFGRGYDFSEVTGDSGLDGKIELQYGIDVGNTVLNSVQLYTFYDVGSVWQRDQLPGEAGRDSLASVGIGSRYNLLNSASAYTELAKPLTRTVASEGDKGVEFNFGLSYIF